MVSKYYGVHARRLPHVKFRTLSILSKNTAVSHSFVSTYYTWWYKGVMITVTSWQAPSHACVACYKNATLLDLEILAGLDVKVKGVGVVGGVGGGLEGGVQDALVARVLPVLCMGEGVPVCELR